jgi:hypothetical protein
LFSIASEIFTSSILGLPSFLVFNPACGGIFFTVWSTIAKFINFSDLNRAAVARAIGRARSMAISMARGGDGKRT